MSDAAVACIAAVCTCDSLFCEPGYLVELSKGMPLLLLAWLSQS